MTFPNISLFVTPFCFGVPKEHSNQVSYDLCSYEHSNMASSSTEVGSLAVAGPLRDEVVSLAQF